MTRMRHYVLANFAATATLALLNVAFVPIYIRYLGIESYGLVGIFATLQSVLILLDLGLGPTTSRELARMSALPGTARDVRDLARTLEIVYWTIGFTIGSLIILIAPYLGGTWVRATTLDPRLITNAFRLMALLLLVQWPVVFYTGALQGLQRHALLNAINVVANIVRFGGAAIVAAATGGNLLVFFGWQMGIAALQALTLRQAWWHAAPNALQPTRARPALLLPTWRFAAGMSGIAANSIILTQADKVILSRLLSLKGFGYYALAGVVAQSLLLFSSPVAKSVFPRFSQLVVADRTQELRASFHQASQVLAVGVLSVSIVIALFAHELMLLWTRSPVTAAQTAPLVAILVLGSAAMALQVVPYQLALSFGYTQLNFRLGLAVIAVVVPLLVVLANRFGAVGGASAWLLSNVLSTPFYIHLLFRRFLQGEESRWYRDDVPAAAVRVVFSNPSGTIEVLLMLACAGAVALVGAVLATPYTRRLAVGLTAKLANPSYPIV
jgi:O-antigen/teichoic acid export membrane protein